MRKGQRVGTARERVLAVALKLFVRHGVGGTSLQMIADELGVTKAAVYYQFPAKDDIVAAVIAPALDELGKVTVAAEGHQRHADQVAAALSGIVDLVLKYRQLAALAYLDPAVGGAIRGNDDLRDMTERLDRIFLGPEPDAEATVRASIVSGALMHAGVDPRLADLDDDVVRPILLNTARRILGLRPLRTQR